MCLQGPFLVKPPQINTSQVFIRRSCFLFIIKMKVSIISFTFVISVNVHTLLTCFQYFSYCNYWYVFKMAPYSSLVCLQLTTSLNMTLAFFYQLSRLQDCDTKPSFCGAWNEFKDFLNINKIFFKLNYISETL